MTTKPKEVGVTIKESWKKYEDTVKPYLGDVSLEVVRVTFHAGVAACLSAPEPMRELAEFVVEEGKDISEMFEWRH